MRTQASHASNEIFSYGNGTEAIGVRIAFPASRRNDSVSRGRVGLGRGGSERRPLETRRAQGTNPGQL